jgi:LCP family protein required for cell wall assembly
VLRLLLFVVLIAAGFLALTAMTEARMADAGTLSALAPGEGVYLIVGSDNRENLPDDLGNFGDFPGARADVIILAQAFGDHRQLLSIPRDLKVDLPGRGNQKINAAYAFGGPDLLIDTVATATGIRANHYVEVEFGGFAAIVDALGGIEFNFPYAARDLNSGLLVDAGVQQLNGGMTLAYARSRRFEEYRDGQWVAEAQGDVGRTGRQREVLLKIMAAASSPSGLLRSPMVINAVGSHLTTDSNTNVFRLLLTGWEMRTASQTDSLTLPVSGLDEGGVSYVVRAEPAATAVLDAFLNRQPLPAP